MILGRTHNHGVMSIFAPVYFKFTHWTCSDWPDWCSALAFVKTVCWYACSIFPSCYLYFVTFLFVLQKKVIFFNSHWLHSWPEHNDVWHFYMSAYFFLFAFVCSWYKGLWQNFKNICKYDAIQFSCNTLAEKLHQQL